MVGQLINWDFVLKTVAGPSLFVLALAAMADAPPEPDPAAAYFAKESRLASQGDVAAEECLSWLYGEGLGTKADLDEMLRWAGAAAKADSDAGKLELAKAYAWGAGVAADPKKALAMTQGLVAKGYTPAETTLGMLYVTGTGVTKDPAEAVRWLTKAAEAGDFEAEVRLGGLYHWGEDVKADPAKAKKWLDQAALHKSGCAAEYFFQIPFLINAYLDGKALDPKEPHGKLGIRFANKDGRAENVVIFQPSGSHKLDDAWVEAARKAKLPPWPEGYPPGDKVSGFWVPGTYEGIDPAFVAALKAAISDAKVMPKDVLLKGSKGTGRATVSFSYLDGSISDEKVTESSGEPSEDAAALAAVINAKYPLTPYQYAHIKIPLSITIDFGTYTPANSTTTAAPSPSTH